MSKWVTILIQAKAKHMLTQRHPPRSRFARTAEEHEAHNSTSHDVEDGVRSHPIEPRAGGGDKKRRAWEVAEGWGVDTGVRCRNKQAQNRRTLGINLPIITVNLSQFRSVTFNHSSKGHVVW